MSTRHHAKHERKHVRGQAVTELAIGLTVFVTVLAFGIYFAEVGFLSLKVQESAISALWDGTAGKMHTLPVSFSEAEGSMEKAAARSEARYADFNGLSSESNPSMQQVFTRGSQLDVSCDVGGGPSYGGAILTRIVYRDNGGARCSSEASLSAYRFPRSFLDRGDGALFNERNMKDTHTTLKVCGVGRAVGGECNGSFGMLVDDWGLAGESESLPCNMIGSGMGACTNPQYAATVYGVYKPMSLTLMLFGGIYGASSKLAQAAVGYSPIDEHAFFLSAANEETNFTQLPPLPSDKGRPLWGTSPGAAVSVQTLPYTLSYGTRLLNGNCFLGKKSNNP
ncbi:MAG TPA: pilus assembly protein [Archangium sp.]|nr:pilus assembly protein [Archangium sp.]